MNPDIDEVEEAYGQILTILRRRKEAEGRSELGRNVAVALTQAEVAHAYYVQYVVWAAPEVR